jgi:integrase
MPCCPHWWRAEYCSPWRNQLRRRLFVLALTTGLRRGELLALRCEDLDLNSRQLRVHRALQRADGKLRIVEPKTSALLIVGAHATMCYKA